MDDFDDSKYYNEDYDEYEEEEEANGHDIDEEDVEQDRIEANLYKDEEEGEEEPPSEDEFQEDGLLGIEKEQEDTVDDFPTDMPSVLEAKKKVPPSKLVPSNKRRTNPFMTKFELSYLISQRAIMIENDSPLMIPDTKFINSIDIAREETERGLNPIILQRQLPNGTIEEWKCSELNLPKTFV